MKRISHRRNTIEQLRQTPIEFGVEIDIRSYGQDLILHHDAFVQGENFDRWLQEYRHGTLILNVKEEGLEEACLARMRQHGIEDFFFLDQSFPFLVKTAKAGEKRCAVRISEFESIGTVMSLKGMVNWVWVDCFTKFPLCSEQAAQLKDAGFQLCLVSPELQGRTGEEPIMAMRRELSDLGISCEAVCTKTPELWR